MDQSDFQVLYSRSLIQRLHDSLYDYRHQLPVCSSGVDDLITEVRSYLAASKPGQPTSEENYDA